MTAGARAQGMSTIEAAVADIAAGRRVMVVDDVDRQNEGDLVFAAAMASTELLAFMVRHTSGVVCVAMEGDQLDRLELPPMTAVNEDRKQTAYAVSVDARDEVTTGISAATVRTRFVCSPIPPRTQVPADAVRRVPRRRLPGHRRRRAPRAGHRQCRRPRPRPGSGPLGVPDGDVLGSLRCDCGTQLDAGLRAIAAEQRSVLIYLRAHEGRGIGLMHKLQAMGITSPTSCFVTFRTPTRAVRHERERRTTG